LAIAKGALEGVEMSDYKKKKFWRKKIVLVTGFEGFLGSHLTKALISYGAKVTGLDIKVHRKDTILCSADYKKIEVIKGNVANYRLLRKIINKDNIQIVFHLAAEALVEKGYDNPLRAFRSNICGTWSILEACRFARSLEALIVASSDKAYGSHKKLPYTETTPLIGRNPYDVSKSSADLIAHAYAHTYGLPVAITRCGNIYGPGDLNFSRIIPDTIRCALTNRKLLIRSDGQYTRDYVYIDDIVNGYILLAEKLKKLDLKGEAFNLSDENPLAVIRVVNYVFGLMGKSPNYEIFDRARCEIRHQYLASQKARKILKWKPRVSLKQGLLKTINWYKDYFKNES
jgi:CDP-glucose 4,6-dehydratase